MPATALAITNRGRTRRLIPPAIVVSLAVVAVFTIGVIAVVTNAYPGISQLSAASVPLVTVTGKFVAGWMGTLVNFGAVVSAFGASLACAVGASRILFALGRDVGPGMLRRTSRLTGAPVGALIWVGAGSLLTLLLFIAEPLATRAVALSLAYGADLIIAAYILVVIAAIVFIIRRRMPPAKTVILLIGLGVLGYVAKNTFVPLPPAPFNWDVLAAGITLAAGIVLPFVYPPLRRGIASSPSSEPVPARCSALGPQLTSERTRAVDRRSRVDDQRQLADRSAVPA